MSNTVLNAANGAILALAQRAAAQANEDRHQQQSEDCQMRFRSLQDAIVSMAGIDGVTFTFTPINNGNRVYSTLTAGRKDYAVIVDPGQNGYAIYKRDDRPEAGRDYATYEGGGKTLEQAIGSIAMILGIHFPDCAAAIDRTVAAGKRPTAGLPAPKGAS